MSIMSPEPGARNVPAYLTLPESIAGGEQCDRCGAPALRHVFVPFRLGRHGRPELGELYFCLRHWQRAQPALAESGLLR